MQNDITTPELDLVDLVLEQQEDHPALTFSYRSNEDQKDTGKDGILSIAMGQEEFVLPVEIKRRFYKAIILNMETRYPDHVLITDYIPTPSRKLMQQKGLQFIDSAGNIFLHASGKIYVWGEGTGKPVKGPRQPGSPITKAKIVGRLLLEPEILQYPQRDQSAMIGVALSSLNQTLQEFNERGFLALGSTRKYELVDYEALLDWWAPVYTYHLLPNLKFGTFRVSGDWRKINLPSGSAWGSEAGAELALRHMRAVEISLYTNLGRADLARKLKLLPDPEGQIQAYRPWWDVQDDVAPMPILYAELLASTDPRSLDTAQELKNRILDVIA